MRLTKNFTLEEFYNSDTAKLEKIDNTPPAEAIINITRLADNVMQKIRDNFQRPVIINSGYRSNALNAVVDGVLTSQHSKGQAADFIVKGYTIEEVFQWCKKNLVFDQLILEKGQWIHVSYNFWGNRKVALKYDGNRYVKV